MMNNCTDNYMFDAEYRASGIRHLCGVDEAGRGPLAGPVFAAAVILSPDTVIEGVNDSKKLSEKRREALFSEICEKACAYGIGMATAQEIESVNILQATFLAMSRAVSAMGIEPDLVLVDGNRVPVGIPYPIETVIKGDARSASIAAASILAKVSRDRYMYELDARYPAYQFAKHKGYGTALHCEILRQIGPSPEHRMSFLKNILG